MERKIIGKEYLIDLFAIDEIQAATLIRDALMDVKNKNDNITDPAIKSYNANADNEFMFDISLTTIKNYAGKYGYGIFNVNGDGCVVKQINVNAYQEIKEKLDENHENKVEKDMDSKKSTQEILAISFVTKDFSQQKMMSIRCSTYEQERLEKLSSAYGMFTKQYLLSLVISLGIDAIGFFQEEKK